MFGPHHLADPKDHLLVGTLKHHPRVAWQMFANMGVSIIAILVFCLLLVGTEMTIKLALIRTIDTYLPFFSDKLMCHFVSV